VTKNLLSHVKPLGPVAFAVVNTHQPALGPRMGFGPLSLCVIYEEGLCPSSGDINRLMMVMINCIVLKGKRDVEYNCHPEKVAM
jgi:hypothetical protein